MDAIRIENLRSLTDTGFVELKPLTLLVGQNSSGKSSFLRFFPLLRQSVEARTSAPISWYGRLVDFGSFQEALNRTSGKKDITLHFRLHMERVGSRRKDVFENTPILENLNVSLALRLSEDKTQEGYYTKSCYISFADHQIKIELNSSSNIQTFQVNAFNVLDDIKNQLFDNRAGYFLPSAEVKFSNSHPEEFSFHLNNLRIELYRSGLSMVKNYVHPLINKEKIDLIASHIGVGYSEKMLKHMKANSFGIKTWNKRISRWTTASEDFISLTDRVVARMAIELLEELDFYFHNLGANIRYIAPVRATAERYYRVQDLDLNEIDSRGQNLAMLLKSLKKTDQKHFENWTQKHFGFILQARSSPGHISLNIKHSVAAEDFNLADTGFGYSQVLPILIQLWFLTTKRQTPKRAIYRNLIIRLPLIFAIEQPELHLHPGLQAKLADVFIAAIKLAKERKIDLRLIIETHSEVIINRIGHQIADKNLNHKDVNTVLFEADSSALSTKVSFSTYDDDGFLNNWPIGFLEPDML